MAECFFTVYEIGGIVPASVLRELEEAAKNEVSCEIDTDLVLRLEFDECVWGSNQQIEELIQEHDIHFVKRVDAKWEYEPSLIAGQGETWREFTVDHDHCPIITLEKLTEIATADSTKVKDLLLKAIADSTPPELPPLEII